ncbi:MAG: hypothetical protein IKJ43_00260 [Bacilli bacterium]|nr:hypothetical protein [Bacilli bacterium]
MMNLLDINDSMNLFSLNTHDGDRPLYGNLLALGEKFPEIIEDVEMYPLSSIAVERGEEEEYHSFKSSLDEISDSIDKGKTGPKLG